MCIGLAIPGQSSREVKLLYVDSRIPLGVEVFGIIKQRLNR